VEEDSSEESNEEQATMDVKKNLLMYGSVTTKLGNINEVQSLYL
jgi:hypothetical protein